MKAKWHIGVFLFILSLFVASQQQFSAPNQEIVVQFAADEVSQLNAQHALTIVTKQLQDIGAKNIRVFAKENGVLKISYFSDVDVLSIKKIFSENSNYSLGIIPSFRLDTPNSHPLNEDANNYKLDVYKIQKKYNFGDDSNTLALKLKPESIRFFNPDVYFFKTEAIACTSNELERTVYNIQRNRAIEIDNSSHNIPEGRAGPIIS